MIRLAWLLAVVCLAGCATAPPASPPAPPSDVLAGRMTVQVDATPTTTARSLTATFDLQGSPEQGTLDMSTPLGTVLAQARWAPGRVALVTSKGETRFSSLDELTRELLGESLPVAALFDWLRGRPWSGADSLPAAGDGDRGFRQLGWAVSLARFDQGWVSARRDQAPHVTVRAKLDRP